MPPHERPAGGRLWRTQVGRRRRTGGRLAARQLSYRYRKSKPARQGTEWPASTAALYQSRDAVLGGAKNACLSLQF